MASFIQSPPFIQPDNHDGLEFRWRFLVFRPALFQSQAYLLLAIGAYVVISCYGRFVNARKASQLYAAILPVLERQFSKPSTSSGLISDGPKDFFVFSTGRRAIASLHTVLALRPLHDPLQILWQWACTAYDLRFEPFNTLVFDLTFDAHTAAAVPDCVFAIVAKSELHAIRNRRWDLTFTRTADHRALDPSLSVMSEFADVTETLFKLALAHGTPALPTLVSAAHAHLRVFSLTDQPDERPSASALGARCKRVVLTLRLPTSAEGMRDVACLLEGTFALVDALAAGKAIFRPETRAKIRRVREDVERTIREEAGREKKEEAAEDKRVARRRADEERMARLGAAEQKKILERERKRKRALKRS